MGTRAAQLNHWFDTPLGERLLSTEMQVLTEILPHLFGFHLVQVGGMGQGRLLDSSRISHRCVLSRYPEVAKTQYDCLQATADALPFATDSVDVVVLPHILEFEDYPHEVLREVQRVLTPEGHVVILGFNPLSSWGVWRWIWSRRESAPWCGRFLPILRIKDWLALLGLELIEQQTCFFTLPLQRQHCTQSSRLLNYLGERWLNQMGAVYVLVARKRVMSLTPIRPRWKHRPALVTSGVVGMNREEKQL